MTTEPHIILVCPQLPENLGAVARALSNFGLCLNKERPLRVVQPKYSLTHEAALAAAKTAAFILEKAEIYPDFPTAIADLKVVYASSAHVRYLVKNYITPKHAVQEIIHSQKTPTGIVFGPERTGLTKDQLALCGKVIQIPTHAKFPTLNLAQSVLLIASAWHQASLKEAPTETFESGASVRASRSQIIAFLKHLEAQLDETDHWKTAQKKPIMLRNLNNMFCRMDLTDQEVQTLHGVLQSLSRDSKTR